MRDFFRSPLFRCLVCLILVCCILVNASPIRAKATATAMTAVVGTAAAVAVVAGALQCLGVMPDSTDTSIFEGVVNDCVSALTASGVFLNGMVSVLQLSDGVVVKNHVNQGIIEAILDWLFAEEVISETDSITWGNHVFNCTINGTAYALQANANSAGIPVVFRNSYTDSAGYAYHNLYFYMLSEYGFYNNGSYKSTSSLGNYYGKIVKSLSSNISLGIADVWETTTFSGFVDLGLIEGDSDTYSSSIAAYDFLSIAGVAGGVGVASGLVAGQIGTDVETDYETWVQDGVVAVNFGIGYVDDPNTNQDDDDDDDTGTEVSPTVPPGEITNPVEPSPSPSPWWQNNKWLNIGGAVVGTGLGIYTNYLLNQSQADIQTGVGDPQTKVDTSLFANDGNGNNTTVTDPDTGDDGSDSSDPTTPSVSEDLAAYTFSLNDIFPFCIPFDLYDFLTCLDAEPVAPVINWEIQLPGGSTYPITVDLSPFDSVAQLLRRLELLVFSIALAIKTRDLIKG